MTPPPSTLEGNRVLHYAVFAPELSPTGMTRHLVEGKFMSGVAALAICVAEADGSYRLCYCNEDWRVLAQSSHRSLEEAMRHVETENDGVLPYWRPVG
jgi:hypothetical protein